MIVADVCRIPCCFVDTDILRKSLMLNFYNPVSPDFIWPKFDEAVQRCCFQDKFSLHTSKLHLLESLISTNFNIVILIHVYTNSV